jgi:hypothetical protein
MEMEEAEPANSIACLSHGDRPALALDHFPTRVHAFVKRNWQLAVGSKNSAES